jgi:caa(3)-type oxidase subunit IV
MANSPEEIKKATRSYLIVFGILCVGTVLTVAVATWYPLERLIGGHGFDTWDMAVGLLIATTKASLVGLVFMHLNHEKFMVYWIFALGLLMAAFLGALLALADGDPVKDGFFYSGPPEVSENL